MDKSAMIDRIKQTAASVLPKGSTLYLYGSRARGDYHEDSDSPANVNFRITA
jgi:predicted nucleotidyltransferase